uniref:Uncharacterized protein n=1 Tax=Entomoneis paludosa TaxID=265537 RepID=A0A7S3DR73_9STRA
MPLLQNLHLEMANWDSLCSNQNTSTSSSTTSTMETIRYFCQALQQCRGKSIRLQWHNVGLTQDVALRLLAAAAQNHSISQSGGTGGGGIALQLHDDSGFLSSEGSDRFLFQMATLIPHAQRLCELQLVDLQTPTVASNSTTSNTPTLLEDSTLETTTTTTITTNTTTTTPSILAMEDEDPESEPETQQQEENENDSKPAAAAIPDEPSLSSLSSPAPYWWTVESHQDLLVEALERNTSLQVFDLQVAQQDVLSVPHWKRVDTLLRRNQELKRIQDGFDNVFDDDDKGGDGL